MTVHGAKGLEAPFVILADATADPARIGGVARSISMPLSATGSVPVIRPRKNERMSPFVEVMAQKEAADLEEHWRLLYVALTRASERLVIAGIEPTTALAENSWHKRVERAMQSLGAHWEEDPAWGAALRYRGTVTAAPPKPKPPRQALTAPPVPDWAKRAAPPESRPPRPLAPSALAEDRESAPAPTPEQRAAAQRGILIHQLLERLPPVPPADRQKAAIRWLKHSGGVANAAEREQLADLVTSILDDPQSAPLFGAGSLAEAPIAATLSDGRVVAGIVDRLLIEDDRISVIDYKTGRAPERDKQIPTYHRAQMAAYAEALGVIFPGRAIRSALLYTSGPRLFELGG